MRFAPRPENDFAQFIDTYYEECRARFDRIDGLAGKWMFRDLIPGMSDFDTRFIVRDGQTADDWCRMSTAVGEAHLSLCTRYPAWARNLEHLPGVNVTWAELTGARTYYPEYRQWSYYRTEEPGRMREALAALDRRPWIVEDEYFHLKRFCTFYGRYDRGIDPCINLGGQANKYPLHSRLMHYFAPPVQAALSLLDRRPVVGKFEALETAAQRFPQLACWAPVFEILHADYETPRWYEEPHLTRLEDVLEAGLRALAEALADVLRLVPSGSGPDVGAWKRALAHAPVDPAMKLFDNAKFSRLMKGRLLFYARAPAHFDTEFLIRNELGRIDGNFFVVPFRTFWRVRTGETVDDAPAVLDRLRGELLTGDEVRCAREFHELASREWPAGAERKAALAIAQVFDGFYHALHKVSEAALASSPPAAAARRGGSAQ